MNPDEVTPITPEVKPNKDACVECGRQGYIWDEEIYPFPLCRYHAEDEGIIPMPDEYDN